MGKRKARADCRADTRGGQFAGIPFCVINSPAYRDLSLWARAILVELVARMNGYNNGAIALSITEICEALGNSNRGAAARAIAELMEHGLLDLSAQANWKHKKAREYRLTFVTTAYAPFGATNDYRNWEPRKQNRGNGALPIDAVSGNGALPMTNSIGNGALPRLLAHKRKSAKNEDPAPVSIGNGASLLIINHTPPPKSGHGNKRVDAGNTGAPVGIVLPADPIETEIRIKLKTLLHASPAGTQSRLAVDAKIPGGTLSRFLNDGKGLSSAHRVRLQLSMEKLEKSAAAPRVARTGEA